MTEHDATELAYRNGYTAAMAKITGWCRKLQEASKENLESDNTEFNRIREQRWQDACEAIANYANMEMEKMK